MVRPLKYILVKEHEDTKIEDLSKLPLTAIQGVVDDDVEGFSAMDINTIPECAEAEFGKLKGKELTDYKLNRAIAYSIDIMIHFKEPGVHYEIIPIEELLDKGFEAADPTKLAALSTEAIEGVAKGNAGKLKKAKISTIKELADAKIEEIKPAGLKDWEAEKFSEYAKWVMEYAKENIEKPTMDNIEFEIKAGRISRIAGTCRPD